MAAVGWPRDLYTGPGGGLSTGPGGGLSTEPGGGLSTGPGGGLSTGPAGGLSDGPAGGLSDGPGGGLSTGPGGGLYTGACAEHYRSNRPPLAYWKQYLLQMGLDHIVELLDRAGLPSNGATRLPARSALRRRWPP